MERLIITLEAATKNYERALAKAQGTTVTAMRGIERSIQTSATRQEAIFARMGGRLQSTLRRSLAGGFAGIATTLSGRSLVGFADSFRRIENRLKIAGLEGKGLTDTLDKLSQAALKNGAPLEALVDLYGAAAIAQEELSASSGKLIEFSGGVAAALRVTGKSAEESRGALIQLGQAIGSGIVRAEEFNAIREGALPILQAVARGLKEAGGSVAKLRTLVIDSQVSSAAFFRAFLAGLAELRRQAAQADLTIGQSLTNIRTAFTLTIGKIDDTVGISDELVKTLQDLAVVIDVLGDSFSDVADSDIAKFIRSIGDADDILTRFLIRLAAGPGVIGTFIDLSRTLEAARRSLGRGRPEPGPSFELTGRQPPSLVSIEDFPAEADKDKDTKEKLNEFERANEAIKRRIALLGIEADVFGKSTFEAEKARVAFELLEAAKAANIPITRTLREQIDELATAYGNAAAKITALEEAEKAAAQAAEELARVQEESIRRMEELRDAGTDSMKGFVKDLIDGKSAADALNNAMQRLADRLIDMGLDSIFGSIFGGGPGSQFGNFGLFGSFKPNTGAGGSPASPAYVWVVNGGVAGATSGGGFLSGLSGLFSGTSTPALAAASPASFTTQSHTPIPVEVKELPTISTSGLLSGGGGTETLTGGNFFDDLVTSVRKFPDFSAPAPTNSSTFFKNSPFGLSSVNPVPAREFTGFTLDDIVDPTFTTSIQSSTQRITSGAETLADSVGQAATSGQQFADGVTDVGSTAESSAGQFSSKFPQAMQQVIQAISSAGGSTPFGGFPGGPFFGSFSSFGGAPNFIPGVVLSRQHGGSVDANQPYIVGERGQELFVPKTSGFIVPDIEGFMKAMKRSDHARSGGGRPITQTNNFIVPSIADRRSQNQVARRSADELTRSQRTS